MKRKGFTLIELLAVIVVLAIIALIATPIVMDTIKSAKKGAAERTAENYIDAVETAVATKRLDEIILEGEYLIQTNGNLCPTSGCGENDKDKVVIEMNGNKPIKGTITISNGQVTTDSKMIVEEYMVRYDETIKRYIAEEPKKYNDGEVVYFNVDTGTQCTSSEYTEAQSNTGVKEGCMKFYAFNDEGGFALNLILDHNTTATVAWNDTYTDDSGAKINTKGPKEVLEQLKTDTDTWLGTETPANYTMDQATQTSKASYTVDYSSYKARLITANEVAQITGNTSWDEKNPSGTYYFDTNTSSQSITCQSGNTSGCAYGWLYDRTSQTCTKYGCFNNSNQIIYGYWTASSRADGTSRAWYVHYHALVTGDSVVNSYYGVRPVIEVLKFRLS